MESRNRIRVSHTGFLPGSAKRFVIEGEVSDLHFEVVYIIDTRYEPVLSGTMTAVDGGWTGDFSALTHEGDYVIRADGVQSRPFVVWKRAYDNVLRVLLSYFTYQRCGSDLGWNGKCHMGDGILAETGERVDLTGGYHQSCDLRKSPGGTSIGTLGMMRFALLDDTTWGNLLTSDEAAWACDYFAKTIQENGAMYNTLNSPFGWEGRIFYKSPAPSSAQWCATSLLSCGASYFEKRDASRAEKYLEAAKRSYAFLTGNERSGEVYRHPAPFPRGMDPDHFYDQCRKGSGADLAYRAMTDADLYRACKDEPLLDDLKASADALISLFPDGAGVFVQRSPDSARNIFVGGSYAWMPGGFSGVLDAAELVDRSYLGAAERFGGRLLESADDLWKNLHVSYSDDDLSAVTGHPAPGRPRQTIGDSVKNRVPAGCMTVGGASHGLVKSESTKFVPSYLGHFGAYLARLARLSGGRKYADGAQRYLDILLGANFMDASWVNGIGYNHVKHIPFGQFFPSTPDIPGAVAIGSNGADVYSDSAEYDMPCVGLAMALIAELKAWEKTITL